MGKTKLLMDGKPVFSMQYKWAPTFERLRRLIQLLIINVKPVAVEYYQRNGDNDSGDDI